jgi:hypothetical protein
MAAFNARTATTPGSKAIAIIKQVSGSAKIGRLWQRLAPLC